jgi:hypothetical protein
MTSVGIRYRTTSGIRIRGVIVIRIDGRRIRVVEDTRGIIRGLVVVGTIIRRAMVIGLDAMRIRGGVIAITRRGVG